MTTRPPLPLGRQRGAALLMALIIVTVVSTLAVSMVWQQWRAVQVETAERTRQQSAWILTGALAWTRLILREDLRPSSGKSDHLGEPWAVPLSEARLSTFLAADKDNTDDAPDTFLSGTIVDAQARFNLTNMVQLKEGVPTTVKDQVEVLQRLCTLLNLNASVATRIAEGLRDATPPQQANTPNPPILPRRVEQLAWLGVDPETIKRLEPHVVLLPASTPVNLNTASREVIAAAISVDLSTAERIVQARQRAPFETLEDVTPHLPGRVAPTGQASTTSSHFIVTGRLRLNTQVLEQRSIVQRRSGQSVVPLTREWVSARDPG